jgi:hypothetical protein
MSLKGLIDGNPIPFSLDNELTINNNVDVDGDLRVSGVIYDGGIPVGITSDNNVWTGTNDFANQTDQQAVPTNPEDIINASYMLTKTNVGSAYLTANDNFWGGTNTMSDLPILGVANTTTDLQLVQKSQVDNEAGNYNSALLGADNTWQGTDTFSNTITLPAPAVDADFATKTYTDNALSTFNAGGGNVGFVEGDSSVPAGFSITLADQNSLTALQFNLVASGGGVLNTPTDANIYYGGSGGYFSAIFPPLDTNYQIQYPSGNCTLTWSTTGTSGDGTQTSTTYSIVCQAGTDADPSTSTGGIGGSVGDDYAFTTIAGASPNSFGQVVYGQGGFIADPAPASAPARINTFGVFNGFGMGAGENAGALGTTTGTGSYASVLKFKN